jgi:hypothetical protein
MYAQPGSKSERGPEGQLISKEGGDAGRAEDREDAKVCGGRADGLREAPGSRMHRCREVEAAAPIAIIDGTPLKTSLSRSLIILTS